MKKSKIMSLILSASILTSNVSAAANENTVKALLEETSKYSAESFIGDYYSSMYFMKTCTYRSIHLTSLT